MIKNATEIADLARQHPVEIIGKYVQLSKRGNNYLGLCPFHSEKTPSFFVTSKIKGFKCHGCGQSGDPVNFLMEHEKMTFPEAIEEAAAILREQVQYAEGQRDEFLKQKRDEQQARDTQLAQLRSAYQYYENQLPTSDISWLSDTETKEPYYNIHVDGRWWKRSTLKAFGITQTGKGGLVYYAKTNNLSTAQLLEVGLIKENDQGLYDFFRNRILFPIYDHMNQLCGFAGRKLRDCKNDKIPKYINSQESLAFKKNGILYGLNLARPSIRESGQAILVEGYTDVITLHDQGIGEAVASCGTALTAEQAKLIARFADTVLIIRDGDSAGIKAAKRDVEILIGAGVRTKVCMLPDKEDPDSFLRKQGVDGWQEHLNKEVKDGLIWLVMSHWDEDDNFKKQDAYLLAADLLMQIESELVREEYINQLTNKKYMGSVTKQLRAAIKQKEDLLLQKGKKKLTKQQEFDALHYGIFEQNNKYFICRDVRKGTGTEISNFVIKPIMLIKAREIRKRLVEVVNEHDHSFIADLDTDVIAEFPRFSRFVESMGNFMYNEWAKPQHHIKIKRKVYANTPTAYPIFTMGWHKEEFFTWGNGITTIDGKFHPINEYGIVEVQDTKWFLPAFSQIELDFKSDEDEDELEDQKKFKYQQGIESISLKDWTQLMIDVHGDNAKLAITWYMACLFRDIIYPKMKCFPHFNGFGPKGAGKSFLAWSLVHLFGAEAKDSFHLDHGTDAAFFRTLSWARNAIAWFDEYKNSIPKERVEALKKAYDGGGREKAKSSYGHGMTRSRVNSGLIITGQEQPVQDAALYERCISTSYRKRPRTKKEVQRADQLKELQVSGQLTHITGDLIRHRPKIKEKFSLEYDAVRSIIRSTLTEDNIQINDRMVQNYCIPLTIAAIIMADDELAFSYEELFEFAYKNMVEQMEAMNSQDDVGIFWSIIDYLLTERELFHGEDILVEERHSEKFKDETLRERRDTKEISWDRPKKIVYVNFNRIHPKYQEAHYNRRRQNGLDLEALKYYLRGHESYLGEKKGKKFSGKSRPCYVFDGDQLRVPLDLTVSVLTGRAEYESVGMFGKDE